MRWIELVDLLATAGYAAGSAVILEDAFDDGDGWGAFDTESGTAAVLGGSYRLSSTSGDLVVGPATKRAGDATLAITATAGEFGEGARLGVMCRVTDGPSGYVFVVDGAGGIEIGRFDGGVYEVLAAGEAPPIDVSEDLRITATCEAGELSMVVNDSASAKAVDDTYLYGSLGLVVWSDDGSAVTVAFDDAVTTVPLPEAGGP